MPKCCRPELGHVAGRRLCGRCRYSRCCCSAPSCCSGCALTGALALAPVAGAVLIVAEFADARAQQRARPAVPRRCCSAGSMPTCGGREAGSRDPAVPRLPGAAGQYHLPSACSPCCWSRSGSGAGARWPALPRRFAAYFADLALGRSSRLVAASLFLQHRAAAEHGRLRSGILARCSTLKAFASRACVRSSSATPGSASPCWRWPAGM